MSRRIFPAYAYGPGPRDDCWWDHTAPAPDWPEFDPAGADHPARCAVAVVGGGFTGLSAALHLAATGTDVTLLEAASPGWGASGRNGGFCCLGGAKISDAALTRREGAAGAAEYHAAERAAVDLVARLLDRHGIDADTHSDGETRLAHSPRAMAALRRAAAADPALDLAEAAELPGLGMAGPFHGALTTRKGFGLNPRKYLLGLAAAAQAKGARICARSPVQAIRRAGGGYQLDTPRGALRADCVIIATNGYSSEDVPRWMAGRYLPAQSTVLVTRPLTEAELQAQGWTSAQIAYDTRHLLHYFRLMPDRRFLFGMRGGILSSPRAEAAARARTRADFEAMFPAWAGVETPHAWSGLVCLARNRVPHVGPVPGQPGMFAGFAYHGNGVAMGSYSGRLLADLALGRQPDGPYPAAMRRPARRFPLGRARRLLMPPLYALLKLADR